MMLAIAGKPATTETPAVAGMPAKARDVSNRKDFSRKAMASATSSGKKTNNNKGPSKVPIMSSVQMIFKNQSGNFIFDINGNVIVWVR